MRFRPNYTALPAFFVWAILQAQECRLVPITPSQPVPKVEEGERALASATFRSTVFAFALSPRNEPYFFDTVNRIRRVDASGRIVTVAGNGDRAETMEPGPALQTALPAVGQMAFSPSGVLHFSSAARVMRVVEGRIEVVAGSGRPGFNLEEGLAADVNLGSIASIAFAHNGDLMLTDGYNRVRRLGSDGVLKTVAGSARIAAAAGRTGDDGPATEAALSSPREIFPFRDGSFWIKDLSGRHLRIVTPDGIIRTVNQNFVATVNLLALADGSPGAFTANLVYPVRANGTIETGARPFPAFTGTPLAVSNEGALYFLGNERPEQRNPLVRLHNGVQTVIAAAPSAPVVDGQAAPFGTWLTRSGSLLYATTLENRTGIVELRPGQSPKFIVGGGTDVADADGKTATAISLFGIQAFTVDGAGRIVIADVYRRRILIVESDGKIATLKSQGTEIVYAPLGAFATLQRIAADNQGNIYWYSRGATPTGGVFTADISVWQRSGGSVTTFEVAGLSALARLEDGTVAALAGNGANFRSVYPVTPAGLGPPLNAPRMLPLQSVTRWREKPYFTAATRLFRGETGRIEWFEAPPAPPGVNFVPDFVMATPDALLVHQTDGGFYRVDNVDACRWTPQPVIAAEGVVNAASGEFADTISPRTLITVYGSGLGPIAPLGSILDGALRATGQAAPYPALVLGNFSGAIPNATLSGTTLPVVASDSTQTTVQATTASTGTLLLYYTWQGLQLIYPTPLRGTVATPGLFTVDNVKDGMAVAINEDGMQHGEMNPAARGTLLDLYGTGFGAFTSNLTTGEFFSKTAQVPLVNPVTVTIGGEVATVEFAGGAPGMIAGTTLLRVRVPESLPAGAHKVTVGVEGQTMEPTQRVTVYVKE